MKYVIIITSIVFLMMGCQQEINDDDLSASNNDYGIVQVKNSDPNTNTAEDLNNKEKAQYLAT
ncbi:hypothetical protein JCM21714_745 [Gracilibacillus boraciitolerans JCM 21714]|uniref:Uncharacterized protein n=1 Tax=Gracilibacillus boraciitolerans JCM 21714 TaxID=1298598 RepID=W4VG46_9BACI|nr:hypothetical protein [Gracilibacillus boraciitolerans]GAE91788.1 hypothetical protein JCM21714_745 [Gracilibacillus boraciitolerans JCM 21714]